MRFAGPSMVKRGSMGELCFSDSPPIPILCLADLAPCYTVWIQRGISAAWIGPEADEKQCAQTRSVV